MKKNILVIALICFGFLTTKAQEETFDLTIEIEGISKDSGKVFLAMYDSEDSFLKKTFKATKIAVENKKAMAQFKGLKKGIYAVSVFHDENNNNKMDTKIFGIPKEPYGFSNNATGFMGPPKYEDAKFTVDTHKTITVKVN